MTGVDIAIILVALIGVGFLGFWMWRRRRYIVPLICMVLLGCMVGFYFFNRVELRADEFVVELGSEISQEPVTYLKGTDFATSYGTVDISQVDPSKVGNYPIEISRGLEKYRTKITIKDTTAPTLALKEPIYLQEGSFYEPADFVEKMEDASGEINLSVSRAGRNNWMHSISYEHCGTYVVDVLAEDTSGNQTYQSAEIVVDTAPEFVVKDFCDYYVIPGSEIDLLDRVAAFDEVDGDVTGDISVDASTLDLNTPGTYEVFYSATDAYGLTGTAVNIIHVCEKEELQELINTQKIDRRRQTILGAINLYDGGIYENLDTDTLLENIEPAIVVLCKGDYMHREIGSSRGSGFIIAIDDTNVIICTNAHVVENNEEMDVFFHDGTKIPCQVIGKMKQIQQSQQDVAFVKVPVEQIPEELFDTLQTIHVDKGYWDNLGEKESVGLALRALACDGDVWNDRDGVLKNKKTGIPGFPGCGLMTQIGFDIIGGMSGSAIVDSEGRLIGMATLRSRVYGKDYFWAVSLDEILRGYEEVIGESVNYK